MRKTRREKKRNGKEKNGEGSGKGGNGKSGVGTRALQDWVGERIGPVVLLGRKEGVECG